jgi:hypothetical protein
MRRDHAKDLHISHWSTKFNFNKVKLAVLFMLNSDTYTEFFYQAGFQRYRGIYMCKTVLYVLMKQAETLP